VKKKEGKKKGIWRLVVGFSNMVLQALLLRLLITNRAGGLGTECEMRIVYLRGEEVMK